jgi:hypothetical protein
VSPPLCKAKLVGFPAKTVMLHAAVVGMACLHNICAVAPTMSLLSASRMTAEGAAGGGSPPGRPGAWGDGAEGTCWEVPSSSAPRMICSQ